MMEDQVPAAWVEAHRGELSLGPGAHRLKVREHVEKDVKKGWMERMSPEDVMGATSRWPRWGRSQLGRRPGRA